MPTNTASIPIIIGLRRGEEIKNDIVAPKGTLALNNPTVIGIVEQAQKGVNAPNPAAIIFPHNPFPDKYLCILSSDRCIRINSTMALIRTKRIINSAVINKKYFNVSISVFM
jgi:hypothetical protein